MPKISQLESATDLTANDLIQIVDVEDDGMAPSGTNKKITAELLSTELVGLVENNTISGDKIQDGTITSIKIGNISNDLVNDAITENVSETMSVLNAVSTSQLSTSGGASKVFQATGSGNLVTGSFANSGNSFSGTGNIHVPDQQGIRWLKKDGTISGAAIRMWQDHDSMGGELIIDSPWRIAMIPFGPLQVGNNASARDGLYLHMVSGAATSSDTLRSSKAIGLQTNTWSGSSSVANQCAIQAVPLDTSGTNSVIRFYQNATIVGSNGGAVTSTTGNATGSLLGEMHALGLYTPGTAPSFNDLVDEPTITQVCSIYKTIQAAKVTLEGNRMLDFSGVQSGMRGVIYVAQDNVGSRTLTPAGGTALDLSSTANYVDRVYWEFDGLYYNFSVTKNVDQQVVISDSDAAAFITAASISSGPQRVAINDLVQNLKAASLWSVWSALYPFVGGSSTSHSVNLKTPGTHNITWGGSVTHDSNGITGDGVSGYGNTNLNANSILNVNSTSLYAYCKTQTVASGSYFCGATTSTTRLAMSSTGANLQAHGPNDNTAGNLVVSASSDFRKHLALNRSSSTSTAMYVNSSQTTGTQGSVSAPNQNIGILARNSNGTYADFSQANIAFFAIGGSLSSSQWSNFRGIIDTFQIALGRSN